MVFVAHTPNKPPLISTLRWGETPMPSALKPQPRVCVPAALQHKLESSPHCGLGKSFIATAEQSDAKEVLMSAPIGTTAALWHLWPCCVPACGATTRKVSGFFDVLQQHGSFGRTAAAGRQAGMSHPTHVAQGVSGEQRSPYVYASAIYLCL